MNTLVIVESPYKANTIKGFLGKGYKVKSSKGHVRDLPKSKLGIDIDNNFEPQYINIRGKGELINELRKEAKAADRVFLAADPDREGEAISWHLANLLNIDINSPCRVAFNEITETAVKNAMANAAKGCTCPPNFPVCVCGKKPQVKIITRKPIVSGDEELERNPRARSAKLRICEKI